MQNLMSFIVGEMHVLQLYGVVECFYLLGLSHFLDVVLCIENLIDALQRGKSFLNAVACFGEVFDGLQGGIENDQIVDESAGVDGAAA